MVVCVKMSKNMKRYPVADLTGDSRGTCPPWGFKFFHFYAVFGQKNRLAHPLWELVPPQENPGSATGTYRLQDAMEPNTEIKQVRNLFLHQEKKFNNFK